jgi:hypothetical protein
MIRRSFTSRFLPALTTLAALAGADRASAHEPDEQTTCNSPTAPVLTRWPLWERPDNVTPFPTDIEDLANQIEPRTHIWNSFGEFQWWAGGKTHYMHTGIDINAGFNGSLLDQTQFGDWVVAVADSYIWATHSFADDGCVNASQCKLYLRTDDHRYLYYYAHLRLRDPDLMNIGVEFDSAVRAKLVKASKFDGVDMDTVDDGMPNEEDEYDSIDAGTVISGIGPFTAAGFTHLHFAIFDACENYDLISPLDFISPPGFFDDSEPKLEELSLVANYTDMSGKLVGHDSGKCTEVSSDFDIVAKARDVWRPDEPNDAFKGNEHLGVHRAVYWLANLSAQETPDAAVWYDFNRMPIRCPGSARGDDCPNGPGKILDDTDLATTELSLEFNQAEDGDAGPWGGHNYAELLFRASFNDPQGPWDSHSHDFGGIAAKYFSVLNHEWGQLSNKWGQMNGKVSLTTPGLYQLTAEVTDQRGLAAAEELFFVVPGGTASTANLVIRDHETDEGAIPSNAGGKKHWRSTSIRVGASAPAPADWNGPPQVIDVPVGIATKVWVRVENQGCETITDPWTVKVGTAKAAIISDGWVDIGSVTDNTDLAPGDAVIVQIPWMPIADQAGHSCMLAAVTTPDDPTKVPLNMGDIDFTQIDDPLSKVVPMDNNLAQRNLTVTGNNKGKFVFGNPFNTGVAFGVDLDCGDLPIDAAGASITLKFAPGSVFDTAWTNVPRVTTIAGGSTSPYTSVSFQGCKIDLPAVTLAPNTVVDAWVEVVVPAPYTGTWDIDLKAKINGVVRDGISVRHTQ